MTDSTHDKGVTLVEMLVVLGIIVVLAGLAVTLTRRVDIQSKERALDNVFALVNTSLREYYEFRGAFPEQTERNTDNAGVHIQLMVQALRSVPDSRRVLEQLNPSLIKDQGGVGGGPLLRDPWGTVLDYVYDPGAGDSFPELISAGPDRRFGTGDDISSKSRR
jgi:prepilin-type N-terminal cleavage/methylation domain-containing protein